MEAGGEGVKKKKQTKLYLHRKREDELHAGTVGDENHAQMGLNIVGELP